MKRIIPSEERVWTLMIAVIFFATAVALADIPIEVSNGGFEQNDATNKVVEWQVDRDGFGVLLFIAATAV